MTIDQLDTRAQIVAAAERVIHDRGMAGATTRAIAEEAGCAEGSIYRYFPHKEALLVECMRSRYPQFVELMSVLPDRVGEGTVQSHLEEVACNALAFYRAILPTIAGTLACRELRDAQRRHFEEVKGGPMRAVGAVSAYLRGEQRIGRISVGASAEHVTRLLLGACFGQAFLEELVGEDAELATDERFARDTVGSLMEGLRPLRPVRPRQAPSRRKRPSAAANASSGSMTSASTP